jgi:hypothetical protein
MGNKKFEVYSFNTRVTYIADHIHITHSFPVDKKKPIYTIGVTLIITKRQIYENLKIKCNLLDQIPLVFTS